MTVVERVIKSKRKAKKEKGERKNHESMLILLLYMIFSKMSRVRKVKIMITSKVITITPELAQRILGNNPYNRNVNQRTVKRYAEIMKAGLWHENGESISIDENGNLVNGQHRLLACIESKCSFNCVVVYGVQRNDSFIYDSGVNRTKYGTMIIAQKQGYVPDEAVFRSNDMISVASWILAIKKYREITGRDDISLSYSKYVSAEDCAKFIDKHKEAFEFIYGFKPPKRASKTRKATIWAAILQAYESGYNFDKLTRFCNVFVSGIVEDKADMVVIKLRDLSLSCKSGDEKERKKLYMTAQYFLSAYEKGNVRAKIKEAEKEIYFGAY